MNDLPVKPFRSRREWQRWLGANDETSPGVWLKIAKKASGIESVNHAEALEVAICHGWIDGQRRSLDEQFFLQKFTPRGPRSTWSRVNREKALDLIARGRMQPAGLREVSVPGQTAAGRPPTSRNRRPRCRTTYSGSWTQTPEPRSSSRRSTVETDTRSCTGFRAQRSPRPAPGVSLSSSRCSRSTASSIPDHQPV